MTSREFFVETLKDELPRFERALKAVPEEGMDYRPHERSRTTRELIAVFVDEACMFAPVIEKGDFDLATYTGSGCKTMVDAATAVTRGFDAAARAATSISEQQWESPGRLRMGDKVAWETTRGRMAWSVLLDLIHHRGQLSVYIRGMGGRVPAIYGASADESD